MTRQELWNEKNNVENNYEAIRQLFQVFGFEEDINFKIDYGNAVRFKRWQKGFEQVYRIVVNENKLYLEVYIRSFKNNRGMNENFHLYKTKSGENLCFSGFDAWYDCIKWLSNKGGIL